VQFGTFNRVVVFECGEGRLAAGASERSLLLDAIRVAYKERIGPNDRLTLQLKSEEWDGMLIDFFQEDIQDRMKLTLVVEKQMDRRLAVAGSSPAPVTTAGEDSGSHLSLHRKNSTTVVYVKGST